MSSVRQPAVAGLFYPADPAELRRQVRKFLDAAKPKAIIPKALIAPHAGYVYSGPVAGTAYAQLAAAAQRIHRVILLGPAHRRAFRGLACSAADSFLTPLGEVAVDLKALEAIRALPQVHPLEIPFDGEHCLEVQLPFLQMVLDDFKVVPLLVSNSTAREVAEVLETLWGGDETLIVISSDLSHYLDYASAQAIDAETSRAIEQLRPEEIGPDNQACGRTPLNGLLLEAQRHGLKAVTVDLRNSGDTAGPRDQVVGYGAYVFS